MRHSSRGATSQKLLIFAVLLVAIRQILRPIQARTLLLTAPSLEDFNSSSVNNSSSSQELPSQEDNDSFPETFNGTLLLETDADDVISLDIEPSSDEEEPPLASSYVLVVVAQSAGTLGMLRQEFSSFEQLFSNVESEGPGDFEQFRRKVRFRRWKDMATFERWLADPAIATVLYAASTPGDVNEEDFDVPPMTTTSGTDSFIGFCDSLSTHLSTRYGKPVLFWPCPRMKQTDKFVPSYETVSFAVKSISQQFNWTEATLFAPDANWALPLALAINLHIPYRIVLDGEELVRRSVPDKAGSVIIVCSSLDSPHTISAINALKTLRRTKLLLLDTIGRTTIFDGSNALYRTLGLDHRWSDGRLNNLLVLTILTESFKHALDRVHGIDLTSNYERISERLLKIRLDDVVVVKGRHEEVAANDIRRHHPTRLPSGRNNASSSVIEWLAEVINSANLTSCDFNYLLLGEANGSEELTTLLTGDHGRCRTLLGSYCGVDDSSYSNSTLLFDNSSDSEELSRQISTQQLQDIDRFCTVLRENHDLFVENSTIAEETTPSKQLIFSANFHLYEYIHAVAQSHMQVQQKFEFVVFDLQNVSNHRTTAVWRPLLIVRQDQLDWQRFTMHPVQPGYGDWMVAASVATIESLWICGLLCWAVIGVMVFMVVSIVCASVVFSIAVRNYLLKTRLSKGPNKIVLSPSDFVFPVDMRRVDEGIEAMLCCWLQQLQEFGGPEVEKPDLLKGSIGSLKNLGLPAATKTGSGSETLVRHSHSTAATGAAAAAAGTGGPGSGTGGGYGGGIGGALEFKARYNGDLVQLKEIPSGSGSSSSQELKTKAMDLLVMAHGLRHENINPLIGWLNEPTRTALVFEHCSRGSLQDVLIMDEIKLDWTFRLSLLTDLVRGMRYLHGSPIRVHGSLSSRNCVVDARWVLKITDYGLPGFYEAQGLVPPEKSAKDLLWTAPEALRAAKGYPRGGTQAADVYSFGIIMQEVVVRGEPFCMLSLSPEEIITKIKKPPPLIRPSVSKGAAPPEAINIMRQCWAESPEMRPDFVTICERFKQLNHGRKVNFVDTMFQMLEKYSNNLEELIRERTEQLDVERKKTEQLLNRMLPSSVADRLKLGLAVEPEEFAEVTIYFSDIVGFTTIAAHCTPVQVVDLLNDLYTCFDATINAYNVYKVETIGDAYMVVGGLPVRTPDHAEQIATMALDLLHQSGNFKVRHLPGVPLQLRIGLHTGPCCAGVVGLTMPRYCLFGDTVNTASRMESTGSSWRIHMSQQTCNLLEQAGGYVIEPRGPIEIKGKGKMHTYWLLGKKGFDKVLPTPPPIGLDIAILRKSLFQSEQNNQQLQQQQTSSSQQQIVSAESQNGSTATANHSSSHSPSVAGESIDVKVEITPPMASDINPQLMTSISIDSGSSTTANNYTLNMGDFQSKTPLPSPQARKLSEIVSETTFLSANSSFNRLNPSPPGSSSTRLFKRIEELIDLSSPYNYYKCLSPSESNLSQCHIDGRFHGYQINRMDCSSKPGSTRFLRRQFSLDKDDVGPSMSNSQKATLDTISSISIDRDQLARMGTLSSIPSISSANSVSLSSKQQRVGVGVGIGIHKQQSASVAQDLEKIEEIPISPQSQFLLNHLNTSSNSTSSLQSTEVNDKPAAAAVAAPNGKELCLSIEALGLR